MPEFSFSPESVGSPKLYNPEELSAIFGSHISDNSVISGPQFAELFKVAMKSGVSDNEFKSYLKEHHIELKTGLPPEEDPGTIRLT